jgi:hypothetical protein
MMPDDHAEEVFEELPRGTEGEIEETRTGPFTAA